MADLSAWDVVAEERIRAAQEEGQFDNLPGFGQPLPDVDLNDPNWWIKRKLKAERLSLLPPILEAKLARERTLESLHELRDERTVHDRLSKLNEQIRAAFYSPQFGPPVTCAPVDVEKAVAEWHRRRGAA